MDINKAILELRAEKKRLDRAISALEQGEGSAEPRTGRRSWNADARRAAAERMKKYWEQRRQQAASQNSSQTTT